MGGRSGKAYATGVAAVIAAYQLIPDGGWWEAIWQVAVGYAGVAAILLGVRRMPRRDRLPWWCLAFGVAANVTGIAVYTYGDQVLHLDGPPTPADGFFLVLYPACAVGLRMLIRRRDPARNWAALVDVATITTGLGVLAWVYVIAPVAWAGDTSVLGQIVEVAYPIGDLVLLAMTARLMNTGGSRGAPFWWIAGSLAAFLIGDTAWVVLANIGEAGVWLEEARWFHRGLSQISMVGFVLFGVAALHTDARDLAVPAAPRAARLGPGKLIMLSGISMVAPAQLALELSQGAVTDGAAIVVGTVTLFLLVVARMAQLLREVERQARQVRQLSRSDELTGLPNRRAWNDELPRALEDARRHRRPVTVALLDLDRFKRFNDTYGHPAGDRLLKSAAAAWHGELRQGDLLARYGGEEFIVLLPGTGEDQAAAVIGRALGVTPLGQSFSAGIAVWDGAETSDELIQRADAALYAAKDAGRNRISVAAPQPAPVG